MKPPKKIFFHLLGWMVFIILPIFLFPKPQSLLVLSDSFPYIIDNIIINLICIIFFYLNFYFFIPKFYLHKKYLSFIILILGFFICTILFIKFVHPPRLEINEIRTNESGIPVFSENPLAPPLPIKNNLMPNRDANLFVFGQIIIKLIITFLLSLAFKIYGRWQQAEREKIQAELSFLKAQINPHFLFNTLNGIYSLSIKKSEKTSDAIHQLSSIMRYVINEGHNDYVNLGQEIDYINDFIALHKMRFASNIHVDYKISIENKDLKIAPLLLISFIENAFKHGISAEENCLIKIHITQKNNTINLITANGIFDDEDENIEEKTGIGIENTLKRLNLLYPNKHNISISNLLDDYTLDLKINLS